MTNCLYYGDNLDVLRRYITDESIDLVYLDPPFKSNQDYNVLFAEQDGSRSAAQIKAFEDTWQWDQEAASAGFYDSPWGTRHPRLQLLTIGELLEGKNVDRPPHEGNVTFKKAPKVIAEKDQQDELFSSPNVK